MNEKKLAKLIKSCKITEIHLDKDKKYIISIEVSKLHFDTNNNFQEYLSKIVAAFDQLNLGKCIYTPMYNGQAPIIVEQNIKEGIELATLREEGYI